MECRASGKNAVDESGKATDIESMMNAIEQLLTLARHYAAREKLDLSTVSWRSLGDTKKLAALESGRDIQVRRCDAAIQWFSDHWPADLAWPTGVARPVRAVQPNDDSRKYASAHANQRTASDTVETAHPLTPIIEPEQVQS